MVHGMGDGVGRVSSGNWRSWGILMIPSIERCLAVIREIGMPDHILEHSLMVERVARVLALAHLERGACLSPGKVAAGALLHDIAKAECLHSDRDHAEVGGDICIQKGFDEIADIVAEHVRLRDYRRDAPVNEKEIVYYADKRVNHHRVVSLDERLSDLIVRYGRGSEETARRIERNFMICREVEQKLFSGLDFGPEELPRLLGPGGPWEAKRRT